MRRRFFSLEMLRRSVFILWMGFGSGLLLHAQMPVLTTKADSARMLIGSQTTLHLILEPVGDHQVSFPILPQELPPAWEVIAQKTDTTYSQNGKIQSLQQHIVLTSFQSDTLWIPSLPIDLLSPDGSEPVRYHSDSVRVIINNVAIDTTGTIKDIADIAREPYTRREILPLFLLVLGIAAAIVGGFFLVKYIIGKHKRHEPLLSFRKKPEIPPYQEALEALETLRKKHLWQEDRVKEYYSELTDIVRVYINKRYHIPATEMISGDICQRLSEIQTDDKPEQDLIAELQDLFSRADLVKFAKQQPFSDEHDRSMKQSIRFVSETIPRPLSDTDPNTPPFHK